MSRPETSPRVAAADPRSALPLSVGYRTTPDSPTPGAGAPQTRKQHRIPALDFTKGTLVLIMVLYHWMNYFTSADGTIYKYLRFLTPSFIFITGFLISHVYLNRYDTAGLLIPKRLLLRGLKLLTIVFSLNLGLYSIQHAKAGYTQAAGRPPEETVLAYLTGTAPVSFSVLVPIAYLLMLSSGLLIVSKYYKPVFHLASAACMASASLCAFYATASGHLELLSIGLLGTSVGYISLDRIHTALTRRLAIVISYLLYLSAITVWADTYYLQLAGVSLSLAIIYWIGIAAPEASRIRKTLILLGEYSLFAYIAQIVILQFLHNRLRPFNGNVGVTAAALLAGVIATILSVTVLDHARRRIAGLNKLYSVVFA